MDFGIVATVQAVVWLIVGGAFLIAPRQWVAPLGARLGPEGALLGRLLGAAFLSFAVLDFLGRDTTEAGAVVAIAWANAAANSLTAAVHVADRLGSRVLNSHAWGIVGLSAVLTVAWVLTAL